MHYPYNKQLTSAAKDLRKKMTPEEKKLWYLFLNKYPLRFLRQKVIDNYILDFYCSYCKLGIEVDGSNEQIHYDFENVCKQIDEKIHQLDHVLFMKGIKKTTED